MASTNIRLFDENKTNMKSDGDYATNPQRLMGVQAGVASSQLQNKTLYQTTLVANAIAQMMVNNGYDANDSDAVSAFVNNLSSTVVQKVLDKATEDEAKEATNNTKFLTPATAKAEIDEFFGDAMRVIQAYPKYLVFAKETAGGDLEAAFGKNNEENTKGVGLALAMYAKFKDPTIDINTTFPNLIQCDNFIDVIGTNPKTVLSGISEASSTTSQTFSYSFEVTQEDINLSEYCVINMKTISNSGSTIVFNILVNDTSIILGDYLSGGYISSVSNYQQFAFRFSDCNITTPGTYYVSVTTQNVSYSDFSLTIAILNQQHKNALPEVYNHPDVPTIIGKSPYASNLFNYRHFDTSLPDVTLYYNGDLGESITGGWKPIDSSTDTTITASTSSFYNVHTATLSTVNNLPLNIALKYRFLLFEFTSSYSSSGDVSSSNRCIQIFSSEYFLPTSGGLSSGRLCYSFISNNNLSFSYTNFSNKSISTSITLSKAILSNNF